jgi:hypothetical protein
LSLEQMFESRLRPHPAVRQEGWNTVPHPAPVGEEL